MPRVAADGNTKSLSTLENHVVPPFYACYLLRSKKNGKFTRMTYVGSSPDPPRRLRQHNGDVLGGAMKTRFFRPWETEVIVYGFPSKLAALQFEWAWQKAELSRYLRRPAPLELRKEPSISYFPTRSNNASPLSKVTILQRLIVSMPWSRLKLSVELYSADAEEWWNEAPVRALRTNYSSKKKVVEEVVEEGKEEGLGEDNTATDVLPLKKKATTTKVSIKNIINDVKEMKLIKAGYEQVKRPDLTHVVTTTRYEGIDGARLYRNEGTTPPCPEGLGPILVEDEIWMEEHLVKWDIVKEKGNHECSICAQPIDTSDHVSFSLCHAKEDCQTITHLTCLSKRFLSLEASSSSTPPPLLPDFGTCPSCNTGVRWGDIIRGCYHRKLHNEDNGFTRAKNLRKLAKVEKLRAIVNGEIDPASVDLDLVEEKVKKPTARRGRPPKTKTSLTGEGEEIATKQPVKRRAKKTEDTAEKLITTKTKVLGKTANSAPSKTKKSTLVYEDIGDSNEESELSERFDFDTDEENAPTDNNDDEKDCDASDAEKDLAYYAAAEGSREMQVNDLEDSPLSSPTSSSSLASKTNASPTKKRRTLGLNSVSGETSKDTQSTAIRSVSSSNATTSRAVASQILEISDSD